MRNRNTLFIGKVLLDFPTLPSTNQYAQDMLANGLPEDGTVVSAWHQSQGKGQAGTVWESEARQNLTLSVILYPSFLNAQSNFLLSQAIALAVRDLVAAQAPAAVCIKWPNDIYIADGKTAGILIRNTFQGSRFQSCIAGIGINVNQTDFPADLPNPVSLALSAGHTYELRALREELFLHLEERYLQLRAGEQKLIRQDYLRHLYRMDTPTLFLKANGSLFEGRITGISAEGRLIIQHNGDEEQFDLKEVSFGAPSKNP